MGCSDSKPPRQSQHSAPRGNNVSYQHQVSGPNVVPMPSAPPAPGAPAGSRHCPEMAALPDINVGFFNAMRYHEDRDYIIVVDRSGSMNARDRSSKDGRKTSRWVNTRHAIEAIVNKCCEHDDDGITLYLFSDRFEVFEHVDSPQKVISIFDKNKPRGSTDLHRVLDAALETHFQKRIDNDQKPTTMLVITDGQPNSESTVISLLEKTANRCLSQTELSVTFIQVGDDDVATKFLRRLDDELDCRLDIVDTIKDDCLQAGLSFEELIHLSVVD